MGKVKNILYYFPGEKLGDVFMAIGALNTDDIKLIISKFGANLNENNIVSFEYERRIEYLILNNIPRNLKDYKKFKTGLKEFFGTSNERLIRVGLTLISADNKKRVFEIFDQDTLIYKTNTKHNPNEELEIYKLLNEIRQKDLNALALTFTQSAVKTRKTFYDLVKKYVKDEEEMFTIFRSLPKEETLIITAIFGKNLKSFDENKYIERKEMLNAIIRARYEKRVKPQTSNKTFYNRVKDYVNDEEEMLLIFNSLDDEEKRVIKMLFGDDLKTYNHDPSYNMLLKSIINRRFKRITKKDYCTFYDRLKEYVRDTSEIAAIFKILPDDIKETIALGFDSGDEQSAFSYRAYEIKITAIMKEYFDVLLEHSESRYFYVIKPLLILFPSSGIEKIAKLLSNLTDLEIIKISRYFKEPRFLSYDYILEVEDIIIPKIICFLKREIDQKEVELKYDLLRLMRLFYEYNPCPRKSAMDELLIFALKIDETNKYSMEDICRFFSKMPGEVEEITKNVLSLYSADFNHIYSDIILILNREEKTKNAILEIKRINEEKHDE